MVKQYADQLQGLTLQQANLALSTKKLTNEQKQQILVEAGLIASENTIKARLLQTTLAQSGLNEEKQRAILIDLGLIDANTNKLLTEKACTKAQLEETMALHEVTRAQAENISSTLFQVSANGSATVSFDLLTASIWANIKAIGKWLLTNPVGWAILAGTAIFGVVKAYDALTVSSEEAKEKVDELMEKFNDSISKADSNAKQIESIASRYEELSKGVNNLGENISLTSDEYREYNDIVNQIAEMFPKMIVGYTDEGNAILSLKGNVDELRDSYKEARKEAYELLLNSEESQYIISNYQNQVNGKESWLSKKSSYIDGDGGARDAIEIITRLTGALTPEEFKQAYNDLYHEYENIWHSDIIQEALKNSGYKSLASSFGTVTEEDLAIVKKSALATIQTYQNTIDSNLYNIRKRLEAYLITDENYDKLSSQAKTAASLLVNTIDENIANSFSSEIDVPKYAMEIIDTISNDSQVQNALTKLFTLDMDNMSVDEIKKSTDEYFKIIADAFGENEDDLKTRLGFDYIDNLVERYNSAISTFGNADKNTLSKFFTDNSINTEDEIDNWIQITKGTTSATEAMQKFAMSVSETNTSLAEIQQSFSDYFDNNIKNTSDNVDKIKEAMQKLSEDELLDNDSAWELIQLDTEGLLGIPKIINGEFAFSIENLIKLKDSLIQSTNEQTKAEINNVKVSLEATKERLKAEEDKIAILKANGINSSNDAQLINDSQKAIRDLRNEVSIYESIINKYNISITDFNSSLKNTIDLEAMIEKRTKALQEQADNLLKAQENQIDKIVQKLNDEKSAIEDSKKELEEQLKVLEEQKSEIEEIISNYEKVSDIVSETIQSEIDSLEENRQSVEDYYDEMINKLQETNDERQESINLAEKLAALENAKNNKVRVFDETRGWTYEADKSAIESAQEDLLNAQNEAEISRLEKEKKAALADYDAQIEPLQEYEKQWSDSLKGITDAENEALAEQILGADWREKIKAQDTEILTQFQNNYGTYKTRLHNLVSGEIADLNNSIKAKDNEIEAKERQIESWQKYKTEIQNAAEEINGAFKDYTDNLNQLTLDENASYEDRLKNFDDFIYSYAEKVGEINNLKKSISGLEDDGAIQQLTDQLSFINEYMEGIQKILDRLQDSSTGFGIVNSAWDAKLIQGSHANGGVVDYTGLAQMHGTKSASETVFNARDSKKLYDLVHGSDSLIDMFRDKINKTVYQHNANATNNKTTNIYATFGDIVSNNPETFAKFMKDYLERVKSESGIF